MTKKIDVLIEDPPISGQRYALITIVGPHLKQKCDVNGIKIRGVVDSVEKAKQLTKRLMNIDNDYDIYTVEVGKFFPLNVDPMEVQDVQYENEQLNALVKNYLQNRQDANDHYHKRKADLMKKAIEEGKKEGQEELAKKQEHPISVLQRKLQYEDKLKELKEEVNSLEADLELTTTKYITNYTDEERQLANDEFKTIVGEDVTEQPVQERSIEDIRNEIATEIATENTQNTTPLQETLDNLKLIEQKISEFNTTLNDIDQEVSPNIYNNIVTKLSSLNVNRDSLIQKLQDPTLVNNFVNSSENSHNTLFH